MFERCVQYFTLDFVKPTATRLSVVDGDTANEFVIKLTNDDQPVELDQDLHMIVAVFQRADGQIYTQDKFSDLSFTSGGVVTIDLYPTSFRSGWNTITLQVYKRESTDTDTYDLRQTTYEQRFRGRTDPVTSDPESAFPQLPMISELVEEVREALAGDPAAAAETANTAAATATNAAAAANAAKLLADAATELANAAAARAEAAIDSIEQLVLADGAVTTAKLANSAVTAIKIANGAVTSNELGDNAVLTAKINNGAVTTDKLAASAVTSAKLAGGAVTTDKIGDSQVTEAKLAAAVRAKLWANLRKTLWSGTWRSGSITVPSLTDYVLFIVRTEDGCDILATRVGGNFRGVGGFTRFSGQSPSESFYLIAASISGNTLTFAYEGGCHRYLITDRQNKSVTQIIGVI